MQFTPAIHTVHAIGFYATAHPNTYIDITATFEDKLNAIFKHKSQFNEQNAKMLSMYLDLQSRKYMVIEGAERTECFKIMPMILTLMMVESETY